MNEYFQSCIKGLDDDCCTIGITGGIGSGKSVVSRILRCNGYKVYDCDSEAKRIMVDDPGVKKHLREIAGEYVYNASGFINRKYLADLIFANRELLNKVNGVVHAAVRKDFERFRAENKGIVFIESAILVTGKLTGYCEKIWLIEAPLTIRIERIMTRDHLSREEIMKRIETQSQEFESLPADRTIILHNDGEKPLLDKVFELT